MTSDPQNVKQPTMTREELLAIIEQAAHEGATELDLSGKGITELPDEIGKLVNLRELSLRENKLMALPEAIGQLTQLQSIDLFENQLAPAIQRALPAQPLVRGRRLSASRLG